MIWRSEARPICRPRRFAGAASRLHMRTPGALSHCLKQRPASGARPARAPGRPPAPGRAPLDAARRPRSPAARSLCDLSTYLFSTPAARRLSGRFFKMAHIDGAEKERAMVRQLSLFANYTCAIGSDGGPRAEERECRGWREERTQVARTRRSAPWCGRGEVGAQAGVSQGVELGSGGQAGRPGKETRREGRTQLSRNTPFAYTPPPKNTQPPGHVPLQRPAARHIPTYTHAHITHLHPHTHIYTHVTLQATFLYGGLLRELAHQQLNDMLGLSPGAQVGRRVLSYVCVCNAVTFSSVQ